MSGFVFYDGPSSLDGAPILGIAILDSENRKTGNMVQTYVIRADIDPVAALRGEDASVCGNCRHRPANGGTCYVNVGQSVLAVFSAWVRGAYAVSDGAEECRGRVVRLGTYGDPAAIPAARWRRLLRFAAGHTGYSHQWESHTTLRDLVMASVDSPEERDRARSMGWRTFRVRASWQHLGEREFSCPASNERGNSRQCINCQACDGGRASKASVAIVVHGKASRKFESACSWAK